MTLEEMFLEIQNETIEHAVLVLEAEVIKQFPSDPKSVEEWEQQKIEIQAIADEIRCRIEEKIKLSLDWDRFNEALEFWLDSYSTDPEDYVQDL